MKTALLIHGLHLQASGWDDVVWGNLLNNRWGIVPTGIKASRTFNADLIIWGSGASEKDGVLEARAMFQRALGGCKEIGLFIDTNPEDLKKFILERSRLDLVSQNTEEELINFFNLAITEQFNNLIIVPAAGQAAIATRRVLSLTGHNPRFSKLRHSVAVVPSDVMYRGRSIDDVVIFMPPHRGDRLNNDSHIYARRTLELLQHYSQSGDRAGLDSIITSWKRMLEEIEQA